MIAVYVMVAAGFIGGTGYLVYRSRDFRKFLAGAFFVSAGVQFYLAWMNVSIPLAGTTVVQTPAAGFARATLHTLLFLVTAYFGFVHKARRIDAQPQRASTNDH
ncbi:MAG: hypothetical protein U0174_24995 [Polyangiaceae bacterium]